MAKSAPQKKVRHETVRQPQLGTGARFKKVEASAKKSGARNPAAVAAAAGRKKYGQKKMTQLSKKGKK
jgi:hypothetical protein